MPGRHLIFLVQVRQLALGRTVLERDGEESPITLSITQINELQHPSTEATVLVIEDEMVALGHERTVRVAAQRGVRNATSIVQNCS